MFGPYDKKFDKNKNGIMEDDEKLEEQAYIRYLAEKDDEVCLLCLWHFVG